jgi:hypothetical protein
MKKQSIMRKNITLPAVLLIWLSMTCLTLTGQSNRIINAPLKLHNTIATQLRDAGDKSISLVLYSTEGEKQTKMVITYNAEGYPTLYIRFIRDENKWVEEYKAEVTYNSDGLQTSQTEYYWDGNGWNGSSYLTTFEYDDKGNQTVKEYYNREDNLWIKSHKYVHEYMYDNANVRHETLYELYGESDNEWTPYSKDVTTYDSDGDQTSREHYDRKGNGWIPAYKYAYSNRCPTVEENYNEEGELSSKQVYEYDTNGETVDKDNVYATIITKTDYNAEDGTRTFKTVGINIPPNRIYFPWTYEDTEGGDNVKYTPDFDDQGNLTKADVFLNETFVYSYTIEYDNNGLPASFEVSDASNVLHYNLERQYDADKRIIREETHRLASDNRLVTDKKYIYAYDDANRQTLYEYYYGDESGNGWVCSIRQANDYNPKGRLYKIIFIQST